MVYENINSPWRHVIADPPDYYVFDDVLNNLKRRTADGQLGFTWPILGDITEEEVYYSVYDGFFFWTLQRMPTGAQIKKFRVEDVFCEEIDSYLYDESSQDLNTIFDINCFFVESYTTTLAEAVPKNSSMVALTDYVDELIPGSVIYLGPNSDGTWESATVTGTVTTQSGVYVGFNFYTFNSYAAGDGVYFAKRFGMFNVYQGQTPGGSIYAFNPDDWSYIEQFNSDDYANASCCDYNFYKQAPRLFYIKGETLHILNMDLSNYETMTVDNSTPGASTIPIYYISVHGNNIYRLQLSANYFGTLYNWSTYNFQMSTLLPFIDSTAISAWPRILPSNGINITTVSLTAEDQFGEPLQFSKVEFVDDDDIGYMTNFESYTDIYGISVSYYRSGTIPRTVNITGSVTTVLNI